MAQPEMSKRLSASSATPPPDESALDAATVAGTAEASRAGRIGIWALVLGLAGFLLWGAFAPLDQGVPSQGQVVINTKRKPVQHQSGGIVKEVLVGEGDRVTEGQLLFRLDDAAARASYESIRQHYLGLRAVQGRLLAEQSGRDTVTFHPDLQSAAKDPLIRSQMLTQEQLFLARKSALRADLQGMQENIEGQQALIRSYEAMLGSRREQLKLIQEELNATRGLVKEGYAPRNRQLELERMVFDANSSLSELTGNMTRAQRAVLELRQKIISRQQEYRKEVESQLTEVTRDVQSDEGKFHAYADELARTEIKSPAAGQVVGLTVQAVGGVIQSGQRLMDIVPENERLILETRVAPNLIDRVHAGLPVDIRFSAFANSPTLVVDGQVISISGDLLTDQQSGAQYYLSRVSVTPEGTKKLGKRTLQAGMPVEVIFKTGERSLLAYLMHPLTKRLAAAMTEE